jgi:hypothetical protein
MRPSTSAAGALLSLALSATRPGGLAAQGPTPAPLAQGSLRGTLMQVDRPLSGLIIRNEEGKGMAWRLDPSVIEQVAKFKAGDPLWMIYRELGAGNRAVTAVGFPGTAPKPLFVNATGSAVVVRSGDYVGGVCSAVPGEGTGGGQLRLSRGSTRELDARCWCCSSPDQTCQPANRAYEPGDRVTGTIILARCFP